MVRPGLSLSRRLLDEACGSRSGLVPPWQSVEPTAADLPGFHNVFIVGESESTKEASSGGLGRTLPDAAAAAIGESLERYCASQASLPRRRTSEIAVAERLSFDLFSDAQKRAPTFPWPAGDGWLSSVFSLRNQAERWAPESLVGLGPRTGRAELPSFSSGLAAHTDRLQALWNATLELLERDALAVAWTQGVRGWPTPITEADLSSVRRLGGDVEAIILTQAWNPCPVVAVAGQLPLRGTKRWAFGVACRPSLAEATERAFLEWVQGVTFAGYHLAEFPSYELVPPVDFIDHAAWWARHPDCWATVPLRQPAHMAPPTAATVTFKALIERLAQAGVELYYRDLSLPDVAALGVTVVRVLSPDLAPLHCDERWPFLGGRATDVAWRYPGQPSLGQPSPNPLPHPLG